MYGKNTIDTYSEKVYVLPGTSMLTIAAPSRIITSTGGQAALSCLGAIKYSKHFARSEFVPSLILPMCDNAGVQAWFSCAKNASRSPSRVWDAMNNLENKAQSLLREETCNSVSLTSA